MNEFEFIASQLKPLAGSFAGALDLEDDAAILTPEKGQEFVVTTDALTAGIHFFATDPPGSSPRNACVSISPTSQLWVPRHIVIPWRSCCPSRPVRAGCLNSVTGSGQIKMTITFTCRVATQHQQNGPLSVAITMIGTVPAGKAVKRSTARIGDDIWVTGTIGDAAMGLQALKGALPTIDAAARHALVRRYHVPQPRNRIAPTLRHVATSAIDISDGLAADLGHICTASGVGAKVSASKIPVSDHVLSLLNTSAITFETILSGGDDYELMFTANPDKHKKINILSKYLNLKISKIGRLTADLEVGFINQDGRMLTFSSNGFRHF